MAQTLVNQRLNKLIKLLGVTKKEFEKATGLSNGFIDKAGDSIRQDKVDKILLTYPNINQVWLMTGEGEVFEEQATSEFARFGRVLYHLVETGQVGSLEEFAIKMTPKVKELIESKGYNRTAARAYVIEELFSDINAEYLITGEGEMLKHTAVQRVEGNSGLATQVAGDLPPIRKIVGDEVTAVPEDAYMMVEYADLRASAGVLGGNVVDMLPDTHRRLVPREYEKGYYLVVRVSGDSMNDGTDRSLSDGDEVLVKQVHYDNANGLPIRNSLFVITSKEGNVLKQIAEYNAKEGYMVCRSFNERYKDFRIELEDVFQIFQVCKVVSKQIRI